MDFNLLVADLHASVDSLVKESAGNGSFSTLYCRKVSKVVDQIASSTEYSNVVTALCSVVTNVVAHIDRMKPLRTFSQLCLKIFRQCAKVILNIQWQSLEEDSPLRQSFLASLTSLHGKLVPFNFSQFHLLESLAEDPWTHSTLATIMGGEIDDSNREEVQCYIEKEDPTILQLRVDMMLKENCEEFALNLCNSYLSHPKLQSDFSIRKTQLFLLYKLGQEDKLQEECQKLSIQDAVQVIKLLQTSRAHRKMCTVLTQTFMVQNWIRPSNMETSKELLKLWIGHQLLVDKEKDQFKESVWAVAKLSQATEQIALLIDVLREECGDSFLQLFVDMCVFAINVDKGQMEANRNEGNREAAAARRGDMAHICYKLACLCQHVSIKVARICALTAFALKPTERTFKQIGVFYDQDGNNCGSNLNDGSQTGVVNPATLYEVERLLNMLKPGYLSPDQVYVNIQILCRRYLQECLEKAEEFQKLHGLSQISPGTGNEATIKEDSSGANSSSSSTSDMPTILAESLSIGDVQNIQQLLCRMRLMNIAHPKAPLIGANTDTPVKSSLQVMTCSDHTYQSGKNKGSISQTSTDPHMLSVRKVSLSRENEQYQNVQLKQPDNSHQQVQYNKQIHELIQAAVNQDVNTLLKLAQNANPEMIQTAISIIKSKLIKSPDPGIDQQQPVQIRNAVSLSGVHLTGQLEPSGHWQHRQQSMNVQLQPDQVGEGSFQTQTSISNVFIRPTVASVSHLPPHIQVQASGAQVASSGSHLTPPSIVVLGNGKQETVNSVVFHSSSQESPNSSTTAGILTQEKSKAQEKLKAESLLLAKSCVGDIRHLLQSQLLGLQQKPTKVTPGTSESSVGLSDISRGITLTEVALATPSRPLPAVELAKQSTISKVQESFSQNLLYQIQKKISQQSQENLTAIKPYTISIQLQPIHQQQQDTFVSVNNLNTISSLHVPSSSSLAMGNAGLGTPHSSHNPVGIFPPPKPQCSPMLQIAIPTPTSQATSLHMLKQPKIISFSNIPGSSVQPSVMEVNKCPALYVTTCPVSCISTISQSHLKNHKSQPPVPHIFPKPSVGPLSNWNNKQSKPVVQSIRPKLNLITIPNFSEQQTSSSLQQIFAKPNTISTLSNKKPESLVQKVHSKSNKEVPISPQLKVIQTEEPSVGPKDNIIILLQTNHTIENNTALDNNIHGNKKDNTISDNNYSDKTVSYNSHLDKTVSYNSCTDKTDSYNSCSDTSSNALYRCILCSVAFTTLDDLRQHVKYICRPEQQSSSVYTSRFKQSKATAAKAGMEATTVFQCLRCFELCISEAGIKQHRQACKKTLAKLSQFTKSSITNKETETPKVTLYCSSSNNEENGNLTSKLNHCIDKSDREERVDVSISQPVVADSGDSFCHQVSLNTLKGNFDRQLDANILEGSNCGQQVDRGSELPVNSGNELPENSGCERAVNADSEPLGNSGSELLGNSGSEVLVSSGNEPLGKSGSEVLANSGSEPLGNSDNEVLVNNDNEPLKNSGNEVIVNSGNETLGNSGSEVLVNSGSEPLGNCGNEVLVNGDNEPLGNTDSALPENSGSEPPGNSGSELPDNSVSEPPVNSVSEPSDNSVSEPSDNSSSEPPDNSVSEPSDNSGSEPPDNSGSKPPDNSGIEPPENSDSEPSVNDSQVTEHLINDVPTHQIINTESMIVMSQQEMDSVRNNTESQISASQQAVNNSVTVQDVNKVQACSSWDAQSQINVNQQTVNNMAICEQSHNELQSSNSWDIESQNSASQQTVNNSPFEQAVKGVQTCSSLNTESAAFTCQQTANGRHKFNTESSNSLCKMAEPSSLSTQNLVTKLEQAIIPQKFSVTSGSSTLAAMAPGQGVDMLNLAHFQPHLIQQATISNSENLPPSSIEVTGSSNTPQISMSPVIVNTAYQMLTNSPFMYSIKALTKANTLFPDSKPDISTGDIASKDVLKIDCGSDTPPRKQVFKDREMCGTPCEDVETGGSKFVICGVCSRIVCTSHLLSHQDKCAVRNATVMKTRALKEKLQNAGDNIASSLSRLECVAGGVEDELKVFHGSVKTCVTSEMRMSSVSVDSIRTSSEVADGPMQSSHLQTNSGCGWSVQANMKPLKCDTMSVTQTDMTPSQTDAVSVIQADTKPSKTGVMSVIQADMKPSKIDVMSVIQADMKPSKTGVMSVIQADTKPSKTGVMSVIQADTKPSKTGVMSVIQADTKPSKTGVMSVIQADTKPTKTGVMSVIHADMKSLQFDAISIIQADVKRSQTGAMSAIQADMKPSKTGADVKLFQTDTSITHIDMKLPQADAISIIQADMKPTPTDGMSVIQVDMEQSKVGAMSVVREAGNTNTKDIFINMNGTEKTKEQEMVNPREDGGSFTTAFSESNDIEDGLNEVHIRSPCVGENFKLVHTKEDINEVGTDSTGEKISTRQVDLDTCSLFCQLCHIWYRSGRSMLQHFVIKHLKPYTAKMLPNNHLSYICNVCQGSFRTFKHYLQHVPCHSAILYKRIKDMQSEKISQISRRKTSQTVLAKRYNISRRRTMATKAGKSTSQLFTRKLTKAPLAVRVQTFSERLQKPKKRHDICTSSGRGCSKSEEAVLDHCKPGVLAGGSSESKCFINHTSINHGVCQCRVEKMVVNQGAVGCNQGHQDGQVVDTYDYNNQHLAGTDCSNRHTVDRGDGSNTHIVDTCGSSNEHIINICDCSNKHIDICDCCSKHVVDTSDNANKFMHDGSNGHSENTCGSSNQHIINTHGSSNKHKIDTCDSSPRHTVDNCDSSNKHMNTSMVTRRRKCIKVHNGLDPKRRKLLETPNECDGDRGCPVLETRLHSAQPDCDQHLKCSDGFSCLKPSDQQLFQSRSAPWVTCDKVAGSNSILGMTESNSVVEATNSKSVLDATISDGNFGMAENNCNLAMARSNGSLSMVKHNGDLGMTTSNDNLGMAESNSLCDTQLLPSSAQSRVIQDKKQENGVHPRPNSAESICSKCKEAVCRCSTWPFTMADNQQTKVKITRHSSTSDPGDDSVIIRSPCVVPNSAQPSFLDSYLSYLRQSSLP